MRQAYASANMRFEHVLPWQRLKVMILRISSRATMRLDRKFAVALVLILSIAPAVALTDKDKADCEQQTNPSLKVATCTRILAGANLPKDLQVFGHFHRGLGLMLQDKLDDAIVDSTRRCRRTRPTRGPTIAAATPGVSRANWISPLPTSTRRSASIQVFRFPITAAPPRFMTRATSIAPSPISPR